MNKYRIHVNPDGTIEVFADNGTFAEAGPALANLLQILADNGLDLTVTTPPEQHRHDDPHDKLHAGGVAHTH